MGIENARRFGADSVSLGVQESLIVVVVVVVTAAVAVVVVDAVVVAVVAVVVFGAASLRVRTSALVQAPKVRRTAAPAVHCARGCDSHACAER